VCPVRPQTAVAIFYYPKLYLLGPHTAEGWLGKHQNSQPQNRYAQRAQFNLKRSNETMQSVTPIYNIIVKHSPWIKWQCNHPSPQKNINVLYKIIVKKSGTTCLVRHKTINILVLEHRHPQNCCATWYSMCLLYSNYATKSLHHTQIKYDFQVIDNYYTLHRNSLNVQG
jgi:hypothetical protein